MSAPGRIARHLLVHGLVQGVFYRESMRQEAARLGIDGWVRNRRDGTVEAVVEGTPEAVEAIVRWAHRGPEDAHVTRVEARDDPGGHAGFEKRPTV
ncbi:acylphosphatase [Betaproteobacteria bacterium GR16-43]|nr:acylphosphatase [Betaproteobacteria bacterium GR16-43]